MRMTQRPMASPTPAATPAAQPRKRSDAARERRGAPLPDALTYCIDDAARITGLGRTTIFDLMAKEKLRRIKIGGRTLVCGDSLRALLRGPAGAEG